MSSEALLKRVLDAKMDEPAEEILVPPAAFKNLAEKRSPWYETKEEVAAALKATTRRIRRIAWLREGLRRYLTPRERRHIELHCVYGFSLSQVAAMTRTSKSSVHRTVRRAMEALRVAVEQCEEEFKHGNDPGRAARRVRRELRRRRSRITYTYNPFDE